MKTLSEYENELSNKFPDPEHGQDWNVEVNEVKQFYRQAIKEILEEVVTPDEPEYTELENGGKIYDLIVTGRNQAKAEIRSRIAQIIK